MGDFHTGAIASAFGTSIASERYGWLEGEGKWFVYLGLIALSRGVFGLNNVS